MSKVTDEKKKHMASFLTSIATAAVNVGILAPAIAYLFNIGELQAKVRAVDLILADVLIGILAGLFIYFARKTIEGMEEEPKKPNTPNKKRK